MATLLRVETDFVSVEIQGRAELPASLAALGSVPRQAHVQVASSDGDYNAVGADGVELNAERNAPTFFEEAVYWIVVESKVVDTVATVVQRDPSVIIRRDEIAGRFISALTVVYRRQVGRSEWRFRVGGRELLIEIEVFPTKLDYELDYEALVQDVSEVKRALALEYFRSTHKLGGVDRSRSGEPLEWITLLRRQIDQLASALQQVNRAPHRTLHYQRQLTPLHQIRGATPSVIRSIARHEGVGEFVDVPEVGMVHSRLPVSRPSGTLDTFEHRWLRSRLRFVHSRLLALMAEQNSRIERARSRSGTAALRLEAECDELASIMAVAEQLLALPVLEAATTDVAASYSSLQLQTAVGYGESYRILTALGAALGVAEEDQQYSLADVNELYEIWCFLKVVLVAAEATGAEVDLTDALTTARSGLRFNLVKGAKSSVTLRWGGDTVRLVYNEEFRMPTGVQKPDIVLRVRQGDKPETVVVLDAKYRLDASKEYVQQFRSPGAPVDAVNALHRYRDAIRPVSNGVRTPIVVWGAALFPWQDPLDSDDYGLRQALDEVGIGAIPLLPGNDAGLVSWFQELFQPAAASLAS